MNYAALVQAIQDYTENNESSFVSNIPVFVRQAEQRIYNSVQLPAFRKNATTALTTGNENLAAPADYLAMFSFAVVKPDNSQVYLLNKDVNFIREAYPNPASTGQPKHYAQINANTFMVGPTPDANYAVQLNYFYYPESIVTASTTWLGDNFDSVLLYGSLIEAYTYMKGEQELVALYTQRYTEALALLKLLGDGKNRRDAYRSGQVRIPTQ